MKKQRNNKHPQSAGAVTLRAPASPRLPRKIRQRVIAVYAARGGAEHMSLDEWRDVEDQLERKLENEHQEHHRPE